MTPVEKAEIAARRFGRDHEMPCNRPDVLTCALWECQSRNKCQNVPDSSNEMAERIYDRLCDAHLSQDKIAVIAAAITQAENDKLEEAARLCDGVSENISETRKQTHGSPYFAERIRSLKSKD